MDGSWISAFPLAELSVGGARVAHGPVPIAVFRVDEQTLYAVDNRCPHEGYPLVQGSVSGCVLTCKWHNFKFDLRDGACRQGEEDVRSWPVRVVDGVVQIDVAPPAALVTKLWEDLDKALARQETGRAARDVVRLLHLGVPPAQIALRGARFDAARAEYGPSHALAAAAEVTARLTPGVEPALPLVQALDLAARSNLGLPVRPVPAPVDPGPDPADGRRPAPRPRRGRGGRAGGGARARRCTTRLAPRRAGALVLPALRRPLPRLRPRAHLHHEGLRPARRHRLGGGGGPARLVHLGLRDGHPRRSPAGLGGLPQGGRGPADVGRSAPARRPRRRRAARRPGAGAAEPGRRARRPVHRRRHPPAALRPRVRPRSQPWPRAGWT
jgi:nitrite reductase/ring-hydroxylating ferredoxin subunit